MHSAWNNMKVATLLHKIYCIIMSMPYIDSLFLQNYHYARLPNFINVCVNQISLAGNSLEEWKEIEMV